VAINVEILGVRVSAQPYDEAIEALLAAARQPSRFRAHFVNVHTLIEAQHNQALGEVFAAADMIFTDGMPLAWVAQRRGAPAAQRVSGPDVMLSLCDRGRSLGLRHFFFGGQANVAPRLAAALTARFPGLEIVGTHTPPFRALGEVEDQSVIDEINQARPDVLWVGLGAPKQEFWAAGHASRLDARVVLPVGAAFDFMSGRVRRAPLWMRRAGLEWIFRLAMDPRRLLRRYLVTNADFLFLIAKDAIRRQIRGSAPMPARRRRRSIDQRLRASWFGHRLGWLRHQSPGTYARLRGVYRRLGAFGVSDGLDAYQRAAIADFMAETPAPLLAAGVLEIGSDTNGRVLRRLAALGVRRLTGLNPALTFAEAGQLSVGLPEGSRFEAVDLRSAGLPDSSYGAIFSVAVFEHLNEFEACLAEMYRLLIPGGRVYAAFGPIWSSSLGHHVFAEADGEQLRHWDPRLNPIEDHSHLLLSAEEMANRIAASRGHALAEAGVEWIYRSDSLNRLFFEDYVAAFSAAPFEVVKLTTDTEEVPARRLAALKNRFPDRSVFNVRNAVVVLQKAG
jgi:N-acetylglucosaminyldiphosphoundecaprenol N-acetyl-beta-D-mannosaminyltransferase